MKSSFFRSLIIASVMVLLAGSPSSAQTRKNFPSKSKPEADWITYSAPTGTFTIRTPESLEHEATSVGQRNRVSMNFDELTLSKCIRSIDYYYLRSQFRGDKDRLVIRELDITDCEIESHELGLLFENRLLMHLTGRSPKDLHSDRPVNFAGLYGRKVLWHSGSTYPGTKGSPIYNAILIVYAPGRMYVLVYNRGEGTIGEESDIIQNFRPKMCLD